MASEADRTERALNALEASTRANTEVMGQIKGLSRELSAVRDVHEKGFLEMRATLKDQLDAVDDEMKTTISHLDNLIREAAVTNTILQEDMATRLNSENQRRDQEKDEREWRRKVEQEEREWRRKLEERQLNRKEEVEDDNRGAVKKMVSEAWAIFKQPFGYLVAGVVFFILLHYLGVPEAVGVFPKPAEHIPGSP